MSDNNQRRNLIKRLFSEDDANEVTRAIGILEAAIAGAGVAQKGLKTKNVNRALSSSRKGLMEDMAESVDALLEGITDDATKRESLRNELIATIMGSLANAEPAEEVIEEPVEEMQDDTEEEETPLPEQFMELAKQNKQLVEETGHIYEELKAFVPAMVKGMDAVAQLAPLVEKANNAAQIEARLTAIENAIKGAPRQASQAQETVIESELLKGKIEKGTRGDKTVLGIPVKE